MGRRILSKEIILSSHWESIKGISSADAFIIKDEWSSLFMKHLQSIDKYQNTRLIAINDYGKDKGVQDYDYNPQLLHISNVIINLNLNPSLIDYYLAKKILNDSFEIDSTSKLGSINLRQYLEMRNNLVSKLDSDILVEKRCEKISRIIQ